MSIDEVRAMLARMNDRERIEVLRVLRREYRLSIHPLETDWKTTAEAILEAIYAAPDLTQRGVRGVLAEATFRTVVVPRLQGWTSIDLEGDLPYDLLMESAMGRVRVQVKNQRRTKGAPLLYNARKLDRSFDQPVYVVETQRTRNGRRTNAGGEASATRPYHFGEFDLLAVCLQPSSGQWEDFVYCPTQRLRPRPQAPELLDVLQPIIPVPGAGWTRDFDEAAVDALRHTAVPTAGPAAART